METISAARMVASIIFVGIPTVALFGAGFYVRAGVRSDRDVQERHISRTGANVKLSRMTLVTAMAAIAASGCTTAPIRPRPPIPVAGLSSQQVESAVVAALRPERQAATGGPDAIVVGSAGQALVASAIASGMRERDRASRDWYLESRSPSVIVASVHPDEYYLQVTIEYGPDHVTTRITGSQNLRQSQSRIHKNALVWVDRLEARIRQELSRRYVPGSGS